VLIDIKDSTIILNDSLTNLKPHQISQLRFWGFSKDTNDSSYKLSTENLGNSLLKLLKYLDRENITYTLSASCDQYHAELNQKKRYFENIKKLSADYKEGRFDVNKFNEFVLFITKNIPRKLKQHQLKAAYHLYMVRNGANFSVPGSGKTTTVLASYKKLEAENEVNLLFVVGPPACFGPWKTEFHQTFGYRPNYKILAGGDLIQRKSEYYNSENLSDLYLTTYQTLIKDKNEVVSFFKQRGVYVYLVVDEAHYIKQIGGNWANAVLNISEHAKFKCILTGTPFPKSYTDAFNMFDLLWPNNDPIDSETKASIYNQEKEGTITSIKEILKQTIGPLFYRVRKSDLGLLPAIFHSPYLISMKENEETIYNAIVNNIKNYDKQDYLKNIELVMRLRKGRVIRLRQCVSYPKLLSTAIDNYDEDAIGYNQDLNSLIYNYDAIETPAKLDHLLSLVNSLLEQKQKVVIWAHFIGTLELIIKHLIQEEYYCKLIYGKTPIEQTSIEEEETRENIREEFIDPNSGLDILVANPAACGESISLHKTCYHAIYYDLSYNCAQYLQSLDRIHRVGGSENHQANYYFLQYKNTIDKDIKLNLDKKAKKMYDVIDEDFTIYSLDMFEDDSESLAYERLLGRR
jgi:SNF2 family DNA or RNA helicase